MIANKFETNNISKTKLSDQSFVKAKTIRLAGNTSTDTSFLKAEDKLTIADDFLGSKTKLEAKSADLSGHLKLEQAEIKVVTSIALQDDLRLESDKAQFEAGQEILVAQGATAMGKALSLKADLLTNYGTVKMKDYLAVNVERLWNKFAVLKSDGNTKIEANKYFFNLLGLVSGANTSITAGTSFNFFGDICGSDNLDINTLFALNLLGTYRSWNANINSIHNLNMGLVAPLTTSGSLSPDFSLLTTWSGIKSVLFSPRSLSFLKMLLNSTFPIYTNSVNVACAAIPMIHSVPTIISIACRGTRTLASSVMNWDFSPIKISWDDAQEQMSKAKLKDILPVILKTKNLGVAGMGLYNTAHQVHGEYSQHFTWDKLQESISKIDVDIVGWKSLEHMGTVFGPMCSSSSVFNLNFGFVGALNASEMDLLGMNYGIKTAGQSWIHASSTLVNQGLYQSVLGPTTLTGSQLSGIGTILGERGLNLIFDGIHCDKGALYRGQNVYVKANKFSVDTGASAEFKNGLIELNDSLDVKQSGSFSAEEVQFNARSIDTQGHVHFEKSSVQMREVIQASQSGEFSSLNSTVTTQDLVAGPKGTVKLINDPPPAVEKLAEAAQTESESKPEAEKQKSDADACKKQADAVLSGQLIADETGIIIMKNVTVSAGQTTLKGQLDAEQVHVQTKDRLVIAKPAHLKTKDTEFSSLVTEYNGQTDYRGALIFKSQEIITSCDSRMTYDRTSGKPGYLHLEAERDDLSGRVDADHAMVKVKRLAAVDDFVMHLGKYCDFNVTDSLGLDTDAHINLDQPILRDCGLDLSGSSIRFNTQYQTQHTVRLTSRQGDISLLKDLSAAHIYTDSAATTYTCGKITPSHDAYFTSKATHYNLGGELTGRVVFCEASEIKNITEGSQAFEHLAPGLKKIMGSSGTIHGSEVYLHATTGNSENHGGVIEGYRFLQGIAKGNILNIRSERLIKGKHDYLKEYDSAVIMGGTGLDDEQVGMYLQCDGKLINDASTIWSVGHSHIVANIWGSFSQSV